MIARITSPIPGPSSVHRPRRKTLRVVARGVVFIQRMKYVSLFSSSYNLPHRVRKGAQARLGAPNVRPSLPSELRSKTCGVEGSSRQDRYSRLPIFSHDQVVVHSSPPHYIRSYYYSSWLNTLVSLHGSTTTTVPICMYNRLYVIYPLQHLCSRSCSSESHLQFTMSPSLDSLQTLHTENSPQESNPWSDSAPTPPLVMQPLPLHPPSPGTLEGVASGGIKSDEDRTPEHNSHVPADILDTFDPLAHHEEQSAREAWANAEGHPPPIPPPKQDSSSQESGTSTSTFPSFSSFARSFALPSLPNMNVSLVGGTKVRPQSLDTATLVSTPVHPAPFASQQDTETSARGSPKSDPTTQAPHAIQNALRRENPSQERSAGPNDKDPPFDFQKFLDQMKSKGAEPVARYLRS